MYVPLGLGLLVNDGVVVLKVGAQSFGLKSGPEEVLVHGIGLNGPAREVRGVEREVLGELIHRVWVIEEEDLRYNISH